MKSIVKVIALGLMLPALAFGGNYLSMGSGSPLVRSGVPVALDASNSGVMTATPLTINPSNGNLSTTGSISSTGVIFGTNACSGTVSGGATCNGRSGSITITGVSVAAGATLAITITDSSITNSSSYILYSPRGFTAGSAVTLLSVVNSAGSSVVTLTNGTGATTDTANLVLNFMILNT